MFVEEELFVIQNGDHYVIYAPALLLAVSVTGGVICDLQACHASGSYPEGPVRDTLLRLGILLEDAPASSNRLVASDEYLPTSVTLFPTSDCNLRCIYCYASAGESRKMMEYPVATAAIDFIADNAKARCTNSFSVSFHGGGEPLYGKSGLLVRYIVNYAKAVAAAQGLRVSFSCATNGVLSAGQLKWISTNINRINLSIDGPPDIQDAQRPVKTGGRSSPFVERTITFLEQRGVNYGVRVTITRMNVGRLPEIVEYLHCLAPTAQVHIEPLFVCGRCAVSGAEAPDPDAFVEAFLAARAYARKNGVRIYNSGAAIDQIGEYFCGGVSGSFGVTPWGDVSSCYEVTLPSDERAPIFFFGAYNRETGRFSFDKQQLARLRGRSVSNISACAECFMKYSCAGDCAAKSVRMTGVIDGGFRCTENRILGMNDIVDRVNLNG